MAKNDRDTLTAAPARPPALRRLSSALLGSLLLIGTALPWSVQAQNPLPQKPQGQSNPANPLTQPPQDGKLPAPAKDVKPAGWEQGVRLGLVPEANLKVGAEGASIYDFGAADRFLHPTLTHTFTLRNDGKAPVLIDHIQSSCGCTSALLVANGKEATGYKLLPGKTIAIKTAVDTSKLAPGTLRKFLWVMMPNETLPSYIIRLDADIQGVVTFTPAAVEFGRVESGETPAQTLRVSLDKRLVEAVGGVKMVSSNPGVHIRLVPPADTPLPGSNGLTLIRNYAITLSPEVPRGVLSSTLSFVPLKSTVAANKNNNRVAAETAMTFLSSLTAAVTGEVFGAVSARPGTVVFGPVTQGDTTTRRITLVGKTEAALENLKVTSSSTWVTAKVSVPPAPKPIPNAPVQKLPPMRLLEVTLNPQAPAGALQTSLTLTTQGGEELILPAFGYITPAVKKN